MLFRSAASATALRAPGPVHGVCSFSTLNVQAGAGSFTASGVGSCVANGVSTPGTLNISGHFDVPFACAGLVTGSATLSLDAFGQQTAATRLVTSGGTATVALLSGMVGQGSFAGVGACPTKLSGTLVF